MVRELVYLSKSKLRQFDLGSKRGLLGQAKATIKDPMGISELTVETVVPREKLPKIDTVLTALDGSDRAPVWFTEPVQPGQWVRFEAPMSYIVIGTAVVLLDVEEPSIAYPSGGGIRLLLHGSAEHVVGTVQPQRTSVDELSAQAATHSPFGIDAEAFASVFNHFFRLIDYASTLDINGFEEDRVMSFKNSIRAAGLDHVLLTVSRHLHLPYTAEWLAGCARVTAVAPSPSGHGTTLFATPLYVERVAPPDQHRHS